MRLVAHLQCVPAMNVMPQNLVATESLVATNSLMPINYYIPQTGGTSSMLSGSADYEEYYFNPFGWLFNIFRHHKVPPQPPQQQWQYVMLPPWAYYYPYYYSRYPVPYSTAGASLVPIGSTVAEHQVGLAGDSGPAQLNMAGTADGANRFINDPEQLQLQQHVLDITSGTVGSENQPNENPLRIHLRGSVFGDSPFHKMWSQPDLHLSQPDPNPAP